MQPERTKIDNAGATAIYVAIMLFAFIGIAALAIDIGHLAVVRNQLQNAADAAALDGARMLYGGPVDFRGAPPAPNWAAAQLEVISNAPSNWANGSLLTSYSATTGYWNLSHVPNGLRGVAITPGPMDAAAVQVTVTKDGGENGGPVLNWFAQLAGVASTSISATATAVAAFPRAVYKGLFPLVVSNTINFNNYNNPASTITIGDSYANYPASYIAGEWTTFNQNANDTNTMDNLLNGGNPTPISIGDNTWIESGVHNAVYNCAQGKGAQVCANDYVGQTVVLPIVSAALRASPNPYSAPIVGFIGFHIAAVSNGSKPYIRGYFLGDVFADGDPGGSYTGTVTPAVLVK